MSFDNSAKLKELDIGVKTLKEQVSDLRREQIVYVASELFYEKGFSATSMDDVASALSIGKPMIYSYFPSKVALLAEVCNRTSHLVANIAEVTSKTKFSSAASQLRTIIYDSSLCIIHGSKPLAVLFREVKNVPETFLEKLKHSDTTFREIMCDILKWGKSTGEFHYDADETVMAQSISGMVTWLFTWYTHDGEFSAEAIADNMAKTVLGMAGYRPAQ